MAVRIGAITIDDTDRVFAATPGQSTIWDEVQRELTQHNTEMEAALGIFLDETTEEYKLRYKLGGSGKMQKRGGLAVSAEIRAAGEWDIALPLFEHGDAIGGDDIAIAYMTAAELRRHLNTIYTRHANTTRFEVLFAIFNNTQRTYADPIHADLDVEPLANGDAVKYPPILGSEAQATEDHYLESGYVYTDISDDNNPLITIRDELEEHFGAPEGGSNIVVMAPVVVVNQMAKVLSDWTPITDKFIRVGGDADVVFDVPRTPGRVVGRCNGCWVVEWRWMPTAANPYLAGIHLDAPRPLLRRVDPKDTGLPRGLVLASRVKDYPFEDSQWRLREGYGVGNRLNGVVMELHTGGTYSIPTGYS